MPTSRLRLRIRLAAALLAALAIPGSALVAAPTAAAAVTTGSPPAAAGAWLPGLAAPLPAPSRVVSACASGVRCRAAQVAIRTSIPLTPSVICSSSGARCHLSYDLYAPTTGSRWPVVVLSPGGPTGPTGSGHLVDLATRIAGSGAVVIVGSWRQGAAYGGNVPTAFRDIGCAIRTARSVAPAVGGNPSRVALVGQSLGGWAGAIVFLDGVRSRPTTAGCLVAAGSARPDAFVGLAGSYAGLEGGFDDVNWTALIGAASWARPDLWRIADPVAVARYSNAARIPIVLIHGTADTGVAVAQTTAFARSLRSAGRTTRVVLVSGAGHMTLLSRPTTIGEIDRVLDSFGAP